MRLTDSNLLHDLERPEFAPARNAFSQRRFPKRTLIFHPLEDPNRIFIVKSGRTRVYLSSREKEFTMAILDSGDIYATHTRAYVEALDEVELLVADIADVRGMLHTMPSLTAAMIQVLGDLLSHAFTIIDGLAFKDVRDRLIELLVYEARRTPRCKECRACGNCEAGGMVSLGLNTETLATIIGSSRQTVSSLLNAMAGEGVVQFKGRGVICIPDIDALEASERK